MKYPKISNKENKGLCYGLKEQNTLQSHSSTEQLWLVRLEFTSTTIEIYIYEFFMVTHLRALEPHSTRPGFAR